MSGWEKISVLLSFIVLCSPTRMISNNNAPNGNSHRIFLLLVIGLLVILCFNFRDRQPIMLQFNENEATFTYCCGPQTKDESQIIATRETLCHQFSLGGHSFNSTGRAYGIHRNVTTCLIHSFSPYIEREVAKKFLDPAHDNIYYANSPAIVWYHGELVLVSRIWLDREIYNPETWPANTFADNWLYIQKFNKFMKPTSEGSIIGIPAPKQWWVGDGPIEPRIFKFRDKLYINFNVAMAFNLDSFFDYTVIWDIAKNVPIIPKIKGGSPMLNVSKVEIPRDKHWMPLIEDDQLYFVHNLDPLRVLKCSLEGACYFHYEDRDREGFIFDHSFSHLRGGTPFELWEWPYYIGFAHTTLYKIKNNHRLYTAHMVVLCVQPYRLVYVSNDLKIHPHIFQRMPIVRPMYIDEGFIFPVGLILETKDTLALGVHVNDHSSVIIRMKGVEALMKDVIRLDQIEKPMKGPPIGYVQTHMHDVMANLTNTLYVHPDLHLDKRRK